MKRRSAVVAIATMSALAAVPATSAHASGPGRSVLHNSGKIASASLKIDGAASTATPMKLTLQVPMRNQALADTLIARGQTVTPAQYAAQFAPTQSQVDSVTKWARSQGFTVNSTSRDGGQVVVSGSVAKVNSAFGVRMHHASMHGVSGLAVDRDPSVPSNVAISGVSGLNTLHHMRSDRAAQENSRRSTISRGHKMSAQTRGTSSDGSSACSNYWGDHLQPTAKKYAQESNYMCGYNPRDLAKMYGVQPAAGQKPTLGILLWGGDTDVQTSTNEYMQGANYPALTDYKAVIEKPNAQMKDCGPYDIQGEQALDVQSSHAIAPNAAIRYYGAASCYDSDLTAELQKMVDAHEVTTISMSFGEPYDDTMTAADMDAYDRPLKQAALTGISTFSSSGDDGNNSTSNDLGKDGAPDGKPHIGYPASSAYITAVGGTSVGMLESGATPVNAGWEDQFYNQNDLTKPTLTLVAGHPIYGAGGGVSAVSKQPLWQKGLVGAAKKRAVPDVAAIGDPYTGYTVRYRMYDLDKNGNPTGSSIGYETIGGTSLSSPVVSAIVGLAKATHKSHSGLSAPQLYKLMGTSAMNDVNQSNSTAVFFNSTKWGKELIVLDGRPQNLWSTKGWDNVTGTGTPNGMNFIRAYK